jgi:peroxiredoxin
MDTLIPNDQPAPEFSLPDLEGNPHSLSTYRGRVVVINFWSAECPWAKRADETLADYSKIWGEEIVFLRVASNANELPAQLSQVATERALPIVLHDADQRVADLYGAETTPHLFVLDQAGILRYQGGLDDISFRQREATQAYLKAAVTAVLADRAPDPGQTLPYGCSLVRFAA